MQLIWFTLIPIVGDAAMSPEEILQAGGSVEFWNDQPGRYYFEQLHNHFDKVAWLNPMDEGQWDWTQSIQIGQSLTEGHMYPWTMGGLESARAYLAKELNK